MRRLLHRSQQLTAAMLASRRWRLVDTGSITAVNLRLQTVATVALFWANGLDLSWAAGGSFVLELSNAGGVLQAYTGAVGAGEGLDVELLPDPTFDDGANWTKVGSWTVAGGKASGGGSAGASVYRNANAGATAGKLVKFVTTSDSYVGGSYRPLICNAYGAPIVSAGGVQTWYQVIVGVALASGINAQTALTATFTDISMKQVTVAAATGFALRSAPGLGGAQSVLSDTGLTKNLAVTYKIYRVVP